ncbi:MAG: hypothetical protein CMC48_09740 [Flavobacteriaceae bacterium]|nr:hypothetical protein [Flavobacteriaceae bacterium]|tara:strand:+ start:34 stop:915 length:882 start_codon:yes stop_codon:yes gene_type:complete
MATINLGRIKPVFRGAYNGATAYVVDDIVTHGDETFICILASTGNATSNATYWTKLAAKGTDGTDVGATLTTQGDVLYRDGSGLQRLAIGTAGQVLQVNSGATAPEYGTVSSDFVKIASHTFSSPASYVDFQGCFTSTYKHYELRYTDLISTDSGVWPEVGYLKASDNSHDTSITYYSKAQQITNQLSAISGPSNWSQSDAQGFRPINTWNMNGGTNTGHLGRMTFTNPNNSKYKYCTFEAIFIQNAEANNGTAGTNNGLGGVISTTAYSGLRFATNSNNFHGGHVAIYGIKG